MSDQNEKPILTDPEPEEPKRKKRRPRKKKEDKKIKAVSAASDTSINPNKCKAITLKGKQCSRKPKNGPTYCYIHSKKYN